MNSTRYAIPPPPCRRSRCGSYATSLTGSSSALAAAEGDPDADPLLGLWRDYADEMDEIVADAYRKRREEKWREFDL